MKERNTMTPYGVLLQDTLSGAIPSTPRTNKAIYNGTTYLIAEAKEMESEIESQSERIWILERAIKKALEGIEDGDTQSARNYLNAAIS